MKKILNAAMQYGDWDDNFLKFPNGLMIQWGRQSGTMSGGAVNITYSPQFVGAPIITLLTNVFQNTANLVWSTSDRTPTHTRAHARIGNTDAAYSGGYQVNWLTIGFWK